MQISGLRPVHHLRSGLTLPVPCGSVSGEMSVAAISLCLIAGSIFSRNGNET